MWQGHYFFLKIFHMAITNAYNSTMTRLIDLIESHKQKIHEINLPAGTGDLVGQ